MRTRQPIDAVSGAAVWTAGSAAVVVAGWGLSVAGWLRPTGVAWAVLVAGTVSLGLAWRHRARWELRWRARRWRRGWPAAFLTLWLAAALGGALYPPANIDALTYRLPRVLHWLEAGRWHWMATQHLRMNYSATSTEWLSLPLLAVSGSGRLLFLANTLGFLLLPGLMFTWLRGIGVNGKAAWRWMWLTPTALGFALQAGSIANDLLGAVYFLAAMVLAQRAALRRRPVWLILSATALGLATGVKASNLALVPMGLVLVWPAWRALPGRRTGPGLAALALGLAVSCGPTLVLNTIHSGHWSGDPENLTGVQPGSVAAAAAGNAGLVALQNLAPPFFPWAASWNAWGDATVLPWWREHFGAAAFPRFTVRLAEFPQEEWAGLGLAFAVLLLAELWLGRGRRPPLRARTHALLWAGAAGALVYAGAMGSEMPARLLQPFYLALIAAVAANAADRDLRRNRVWQVAAAAAVLVALAAVTLTPLRPLFPAARLWAQVGRMWPDSGLVARAVRVYAVDARRPDMLAEVRRDLRPEETAVGFLATDDDSEWSLWQPLGARHVVHVLGLGDSGLTGLQVLVVRADTFWNDPMAEEAAFAGTGWRIAARHEIVVKAARPAERWLVARPSS